MADWNADQYLKFADERNKRASVDLLARVPLDKPRRIMLISAADRATARN